MPVDLIYILAFTGVGILFVAVSIGVAKMLAPYDYTKLQGYPYECGEKVIGMPWVQFHIRYYIFALLFLIFDIETVFLYPWALIFKDLIAQKLGLFGLVEIGIFIIILLLGLIYPWRKGVLKWIY